MEWSRVVTSDCCMQHLRHSTPLYAEGKLFGIAIFDLISKWPLRSFCWGNTYRSGKWNLLLLRWAVGSIAHKVRCAEGSGEWGAVQGQLAAERGGELECIHSKCFDLCFCASTAVKTQMQRTVVAVAVAVRVSLLAFSFKMFNYAAVLPPPFVLPSNSIPMSSRATTCCSFIHSICQFCTRLTIPSPNPSRNPTASWTRSRFPGRVKRLSPHLQHFYSLIIIILIIIIVIMIMCLQHDAAVSIAATATTNY